MLIAGLPSAGLQKRTVRVRDPNIASRRAAASRGYVVWELRNFYSPPEAAGALAGPPSHETSSPRGEAYLSLPPSSVRFSLTE